MTRTIDITARLTIGALSIAIGAYMGTAAIQGLLPLGASAAICAVCAFLVFDVIREERIR